MSEPDARIDQWADALRSVGTSDRRSTGGEPDVLVERRKRRGDGTGPGVAVRVRDATGDVSSVDLSPAEARRLAGQLTAAASGDEAGDDR